MSKNIVGDVKVWLSSSYGPESLQSDDVINKLNYANNDMSKYGWTYVGNATISVDLFNTEKIILEKVGALKNEIAKEKATSQLRLNALQEKIDNLLAITDKSEL